MANDTSEIHVITNGSWISGSEDPKKEPGPHKLNATINGGQNYTTPPLRLQVPTTSSAPCIGYADNSDCEIEEQIQGLIQFRSVKCPRPKP